MKAAALAAPLALVLALGGCERSYWVRADARPAPSGWIRARCDGGKDVAIRFDALGPVARLPEGHGEWRVAYESTRHPRARVLGIFSIVLGTGLLGAAVALGVPHCIGDRCGDGALYGGILGSLGGALSLGGAGLLWWAWPVPIHTEPLSAHPEL